MEAVALGLATACYLSYDCFDDGRWILASKATLPFIVSSALTLSGYNVLDWKENLLLLASTQGGAWGYRMLRRFTHELLAIGFNYYERIEKIKFESSKPTFVPPPPRWRPPGK
jgi:hypothetical protein